MAGYRTRQRSLLIDFFSANPDRAFTIDEVALALRSDEGDAAPARSTLYRTVSDLVREGMLRREYVAERRHSVYQHRDGHACATHLHMRCARCGALTHLDAEVSGAIASLLRKDADIALDLSGTMLVGDCARCGKV